MTQLLHHNTVLDELRKIVGKQNIELEDWGIATFTGYFTKKMTTFYLSDFQSEIFIYIYA
ncbi:hypothetical protein [Thomasclavelia spiroformis]|uniref:hypothetical protein n=1 Tax=Thomasclavelia spiroformis TaxID=29348 RepID=UPI000B37A17F|nr:hypothetical protein [Thomasclavelia spiroformis]OUO65827.1 hypothetical protein B5F64_11685 [Thomasclavelia spiroformis]